MICNETSHRLIYRVSIFCICFHLATSVHSIAFHISTSSSAGYFDPFSYDEFSLSSSPEVLWTLSNINRHGEREFSLPNSNRGDIKLTNVTVPGCVHTALIEKQFIQEDLLYRYNEETSFFGGNEYLNFDTKDLRSPTFAISKIEMREVYHHYLFTNQYRFDQEYTYFPDINGDFVVRTMQGEDVSREAEYSKVHFSLPYSNLIGLDDVYVIGKFNNYALSEENKMTFNEESGKFEVTLPIKQGFYNYKYVVQREDGTLEPNLVSGNFHFTENNYLILVYYRDFGEMYDSIIGIGSVNSQNISN